MTDNESRRNRLESLRTEYLACTQRIAASGGWAWQSTGIVVGAAFAAAALVLTRIHDIPVHMVVSLGFCIICILLALPFYFRRERWRQHVLFNRNREIEEELGLEIGLDIDRLDKLRGAGKKEEVRKKLRKEFVDSEHINRYWKLHQELPAPLPLGWDVLYVLVNFAVLAWLLIVLESWQEPGGWAFLGVGVLLLASIDYRTWPWFRSGPLGKKLEWLIRLFQKGWSFVRG